MSVFKEMIKMELLNIKSPNHSKYENMSILSYVELYHIQKVIKLGIECTALKFQRQQILTSHACIHTYNVFIMVHVKRF